MTRGQVHHVALTFSELPAPVFVKGASEAGHLLLPGKPGASYPAWLKAKAARPGDQVLVMSNGGFGGIHDKLLKALA